MNAFSLDFKTWPPPVSTITHGVSAPVGSVRIGKSGRSNHREIKVRLDGPVSQRWMHLARYWWTRNKGPVPDGKRVGHIDGDCMNDEPSNYALFTYGDTFAVWEDTAAAGSIRAARRRMSQGTVRSNILRAEIRRATGFCPTLWYAVNFERRLIFNTPFRKRWMVYAAHGVQLQVGGNDAGVDAAILGFPGVNRLAAFVLACLSRRALDSDALWKAVLAELAYFRSRVPRHQAAMHLAMVPIRKQGLIVSRHRGRRGALHEITNLGRLTRSPACPVVAVRGRDLENIAFRDFSKDDQQEAA